MPTPSLLIVPARFKSGKLYSQIPTSGAGDFTVTRATNATRVNASGFIESVASGIPRLDYFSSDGTPGCPALLVEPAATNFARNVEFMTQVDTPAASGGLTITTGSTDFLAPDGTSGSITKYVGGAASGISQFAYDGSAYTVTSAGQHTFSLFVKAGSSNPANFIRLRFAGWTSASGTSDTFFSLASGTALTVGASIQDYGNGWYRLISAPYTIASGDLQGLVTVSLAEAPGDVTWPVSGALNLTAYTWGVQLEAGSVPTSYIPTTTGSVNRNADVINKTSVSGLIGQTEGTIYVEVDVRTFPQVGSPVVGIVALNVGANNLQNAIILGVERQSGGTNRFYSLVQVSNATQAALFGSTLTNGIYKVALTYKQNDFAMYVNGASVATDNSGNVPTCSEVLIGTRFNTDTVFLNDRILATALYTTRLSNAQLAALTSL